MTRWDPDHVDYLLEWEGFIPLEDIAQTVGRSLKAVEMKLARLKGVHNKHHEELLMTSRVSRPTFYGKRKFTTYRRSA